MATTTEETGTVVVEEEAEVEGGEVSPRRRGTRTLLSDLIAEITTLFRQEVALAKQETSEKARVAVRNTASIAGGGGVAFAGLNFLLLAATAGLFVGLWQVMAWYHALWLSPLIVGAVVAIVGYAMIKKGKHTLNKQSMVPEKTVDTMRENTQWLKQEMT
ncbi:MAG: phage holin family protein [Planctomycetota bacterium]